MVEVWLQKLVDGMQGTVKSTIKRAYRNVQEMALEDFIFGHPAQIALLGIQFQWTADTQVLDKCMQAAILSVFGNCMQVIQRLQASCCARPVSSMYSRCKPFVCSKYTAAQLCRLSE